MCAAICSRARSARGGGRKTHTPDGATSSLLPLTNLHRPEGGADGPGGAAAAAEDDCVVCLCPPSDPASPDGCSHRFCFECISAWAQQTNRCPLCKAQFEYIVRGHGGTPVRVSARELRPDDAGFGDDEYYYSDENDDGSGSESDDPVVQWSSDDDGGGGGDGGAARAALRRLPACTVRGEQRGKARSRFTRQLLLGCLFPCAELSLAQRRCPLRAPHRRRSAAGRMGRCSRAAAAAGPRTSTEPAPRRRRQRTAAVALVRARSAVLRLLFFFLCLWARA